MPISWKGTLQQYAGRLHRLYKTKKEVKIYDYVDIQVKMLERMYQSVELWQCPGKHHAH
jgi:superfamily II DNA or RNA helicase